MSTSQSWHRVFAGRADQVPLARMFTVFLFADFEIDSTVGFVVTELATNAVRHTRSGEHKGSFAVELLVGDLVYIGVSDLGGHGYPVVREHPREVSLSESEGGRGLWAVAQMATLFGIYGSPAEGHTVWAGLDSTGQPRDKPPEAIQKLPAVGPTRP
ncbi:ATP-binding protein [Actinomadura macra]|uniref:ATP-binding protein n=1 Tax=Actinomadura macra TaxID=46164 RepID=UPI00082D90A9|nr:ATP-binding protein [Actinomadura macra]